MNLTLQRTLRYLFLQEMQQKKVRFAKNIIAAFRFHLPQGILCDFTTASNLKGRERKEGKNEGRKESELQNG